MSAHTTAIVISGDAINIKPSNTQGGIRVEFPDSGVSVILSASSAQYLAAGLTDITRPKIAAVPDEPRRVEPDAAYNWDDRDPDDFGPNVNEHGVDMTPGYAPRWAGL